MATTELIKALETGQEPQFDEREIAKEMAIRSVQAAIDVLYETIPPAFAHQFATDARDEADRRFRTRGRQK